MCAAHAHEHAAHIHGHMRARGMRTICLSRVPLQVCTDKPSLQELYKCLLKVFNALEHHYSPDAPFSTSPANYWCVALPAHRCLHAGCIRTRRHIMRLMIRQCHCSAHAPYHPNASSTPARSTSTWRQELQKARGAAACGSAGGEKTPFMRYMLAMKAEAEYLVQVLSEAAHCDMYHKEKCALAGADTHTLLQVSAQSHVTCAWTACAQHAHLWSLAPACCCTATPFSPLLTALYMGLLAGVLPPRGTRELVVQGVLRLPPRGLHAAAHGPHSKACRGRGRRRCSALHQAPREGCLQELPNLVSRCVACLYTRSAL